MKKQLPPTVRALCDRVRRPATMRLLIGLGLIAPAALIGDKDSARTSLRVREQLPILTPLIVDVSPEALAKAKAENPVFEVWKKGQPEYTIGPSAVRYAREYKISEPLAAQIHHAAVDGVGGAALMCGLLDAERVASPIRSVDAAPQAEPAPSPAVLLADAAYSLGVFGVVEPRHAGLVIGYGAIATNDIPEGMRRIGLALTV